MRVTVTVALLLLLLGAAAKTTSRAPVVARFTSEIRPVLEKRCQPCHFSGGTMYARLPFDRPETVASLGTKMFTRIKDEPSRAAIRRFLADWSRVNLNARPAASCRTRHATRGAVAVRQ